MTRSIPKRKSRPTKEERRHMEIYDELNGRWDQGSADRFV